MAYKNFKEYFTNKKYDNLMVATKIMNMVYIYKIDIDHIFFSYKCSRYMRTQKQNEPIRV